MSETSSVDAADTPPRTWIKYTALAWSAVLLLSLGQGILQNFLVGRTADPVWLLRWRAFPVLLWTAFTPVVRGLVRRWPIKGHTDVRRGLVHTVVAGSWVVLSNLALRVPDLVAGVDPATVWESTASSAIELAPACAAVYIVLAVLLQRSVSAVPSNAPDGDASDPFAGTLALRENDRVYLVAPDDVLWLEADGDHVRVHTGERSYRVRGTLKSFARRLRPRGFLRVHRSHVINLAHVQEFQPYHHGDYVAVMDDGTALRVPRSREEVTERLRDLFRQEPSPGVRANS